ncbi:MAG TPA: hypothetical protein VFB59_01075 [Candidatus Saccharimonadales bacterium]|nr:hypothetical protein [Candidatus Saccharimonadales bacterium]
MNRVATNPEQGRVLGKALVIIVILFVLLGGWFLFTQRSAEATARNETDRFAKLLVAKDANASYDMLGDTIKEQTSKESWQAWLDFAFENAEEQPVFVEELVIHEPAATYGEGTPVARFVYSFKVSGKDYKAPFVIVKKDGVWKISEIGAFE